MARNKDQARKRRHYRTRKTMIGTGGKPRLTVFRSLRHVYAQLIDDTNGRTIVSASTLEKQVGGSGHRGNAEAARRVGASIAKKALGKEIKSIVFDRSGYQYHGCIKALADAAREQGLSF